MGLAKDGLGFKAAVMLGFWEKKGGGDYLEWGRVLCKLTVKVLASST